MKPVFHITMPLERGRKQFIGHIKAKQKLDTYQQKE